MSSQWNPSEVSRVVAFTRDVDSEKAKNLKKHGIEVLPAEPTAEAFKGIDVFVNAANVFTPEGFEDLQKFVKASIDGGVKVFIPAEYGL